MVENVILDVCNFLKSKHILIPSHNQWLRGSIACFRESNRNCTPNQLKEFVFTQWKLADLKDICAPSLPNNCKTANKLILPGKYAIQINNIVNIGESFYKQLQKIRRPAAEDNLSVDAEKEKGSTDVPSNRTLKLEITDGIMTLLGFEDKLVSKIIEPFVPGVKAILSGPIECRKGVLFLKNENIDILGGEVDTLLVPNAPENLLARALKQTENPDPYRSIDSNQNNHDDQQTLLDIPEDDAEAFLQIPDDIGNSQTAVSHVESYSHSSSNFTQRNKSATECNSGTTFSNTVTQSRSFSTNYSRNNLSTSTFVTPFSESPPPSNSDLNQSLNCSIIDLEDDDEEFALIAAQTASLAEQTVKSNKTPPNSKQTSLHNFFSHSGSQKNAKLKNSDLSNKSNNVNNQSEVSKTVSNTVRNSENNLRDQLQESYSSFMECDSGFNGDTYKSIFNKNMDDNHQSTSSKTKEKKTTGVELSKQERPRTGEVLSFPPKKYPCTLTVRVSVESICDKLRISERRWTMSAVTKIRGVEMEVDFSPEALDKVIGMSAAEVHSKKKESKKNTELREQINIILKSSQVRIHQLNCDMEVHFTSYISKPIVLQIFN